MFKMLWQIQKKWKFPILDIIYIVSVTDIQFGLFRKSLSRR